MAPAPGRLSTTTCCPSRLLELLRHHAGRSVDRAPRRERHDDADRAGLGKSCASVGAAASAAHSDIDHRAPYTARRVRVVRSTRRDCSAPPPTGRPLTGYPDHDGIRLHRRSRRHPGAHPAERVLPRSGGPRADARARVRPHLAMARRPRRRRRAAARSRRASCWPGTSTSRCCSRATPPASCAACPTSAPIAATSWCAGPAGPSRSAAATTRAASISRAA